MLDKENFEKMSVEEQEKLFRESPLKDRAEMLLYCHEPERLASRISQEELYLITRELDIDEKVEIIRSANREQIFFMTDMECWQRDRLNNRGFVSWLEILLQAGHDKLLSWFLTADYEFIAAGFQEIIQVTKPEWEYAVDEKLGDTPYFTFDEYYFVSVLEEDKFDTVKQALQVLFEKHRGKYTALMESILSEMEDELEEEAYRRREIRMTERGFPAQESALQIYKPISREELEEYPVKSKDVSPKTPEHVRPDYPALWSKEKFFLDDVLTEVRIRNPELMEGLEEELAWLSNKVIACTGVDFADESKITKAIERVRALTSLGFDLLSDHNVGESATYARRHWLETIFRFGFSHVLRLRQIGEKILSKYWPGEKTHFLEFLDEPYGKVFENLFRRVPQYFDFTKANETEAQRDFHDRRDLEIVEMMVRQIESIHYWIHEKFPAFFKPRKFSAEEKPSVTLTQVLGTAFASYGLTKKISLAPLSENDLKKWLAQDFVMHETRRALKPELKTDFLEKFFSESEKKNYFIIWGLVFDRIDAELGGLLVKEKTDFRFVQCLLLKESVK